METSTDPLARATRRSLRQRRPLAESDATHGERDERLERGVLCVVSDELPQVGQQRRAPSVRRL